MRRVRGFIDLVFDVVEETTNLVERTHDAVVERSARRFAPIEPATSTAKVITGVETAISGGVFESIRVLNGFSRFTVNAVADVAEAGLDQPTDAEELQLATPIKSTAAGTASWYVAAAFPNPTNKVCVFVHSLAATEWLWSLSSEEHYGDPDVTFGTRLADDLGFTPIYLRYNTGRHISENGRALAKLIAEVLDAYPVPVEEIALVGHSMGGLVVRSAAHYAREHDEPWVAHLRHVACIGSPHLGAPLEKAVNVLTNVLRKVDAAGAHVPAELLDSRSAGIKDLRYGYTIDEEWAGRDPDEVFADARRHVPLVDGVGYYFLAATIARDPAHPLGQLLGDLMVRLPSASGEAPEHARRIHFSGGAVFPGMNHIHIANHPDVYEALRDLLAA
ncbi:MAG: alpha/beta hydrolase [Deltaproteobacteria bacterium]|nr:alpha/beta hydrolase [Deltaproteobacteria bacterium]